MKYTTIGDVCGGCGHNHKTIRTAYDCIKRHHSAIQRFNGLNAYSDRNVVRVDEKPLDEWERDRLLELFEEH